MRRYREISLFVAWFISQIRFFIATGVPVTFSRVYKIVAAIFSLVKTDVIKNKEFRFRPETNGIRDTGSFQRFLSFFRYIAWISRIRLFGQRVVYIANNRKRWNRADRIKDKLIYNNMLLYCFYFN